MSIKRAHADLCHKITARLAETMYNTIESDEKNYLFILVGGAAWGFRLIWINVGDEDPNQMKNLRRRSPCSVRRFAMAAPARTMAKTAARGKEPSPQPRSRTPTLGSGTEPVAVKKV